MSVPKDALYDAPAPRGRRGVHTLSVLVQNKPGVLARISGMFARRAFNIESLAVGPTDDPQISRMTIVVKVQAKPNPQMEVSRHPLPSGCCQWLVATQAGRVIPPPVLTRF